MKLTFYLQYFNYNDENFEVSDTYFQDSNDYIKQLEESYNQTKDVIFDAMSSGNFGDKNTYKMPLSKPIEKKDTFSYAKCDGVFIDDNGEELDGTSIDILATIQDIFLGTLKLDTPIEDEDFETNWKMFLDSSHKIMGYNTDEDWIFTHQPKKDIYFSFEDKNGNAKYGKMVNCRLMDSSNMYENILIVEKLVLIKNLE